MSQETPDNYFASDGSGIDISVARAISERKTDKVMGDPSAPRKPDGLSRDVIGELLSIAGNAPFHHPANPRVRAGGAKEPWRVHMLDGQGCRAFLPTISPDDKPGKILDMLAAAETLLCVTWLPEPEGDEGDAPAQSHRNFEHVAATAAFIQSLLIAATSAEIPNYWSSGGVLRDRKYLSRLGASETEELLGAVFLFPYDLSGLDVRSGMLRGERSAPNEWAYWVEV